MDATRRVRVIRLLCNEQGAMLVYVAVVMVVFILVAGLAIDLGYMFVTKTQLQNAADAGALAGARKMRQVGLANDANQTSARFDAMTTAQRNTAASTKVQLASNGSNTLSKDNDITVGHWNSLTHTYSPGAPGTNIFNAIQVRTRRANLSPAGPVGTFVAKIVPGLHTMEVASQGIATIPMMASNYTAFCSQACGTCNYDPSNTAVNPNDPSTWPAACRSTVISQPSPDPSGTNSADKFAWTTLLSSTTSSSALRQLVQGKAPTQNVCGKQIYTTMGTDTDVMRDMESNMYNPSYDVDSKTKNGSGEVTEWWIVVPVTSSCPPGASGGWDPKSVTGYAKIRVQAICVNGAAGYSGYESGPGECNGTYNGNIVYDRIMCVDCAHADVMFGTKVNLVK